MKLLNLISVITCLMVSVTLNSQTEILIIGTMHDQPEGVPDNYAPILDIVDQWNPDVICTEYMLPKDTISIRKSYGESYFQEKDSIAKAWKYDLSDVKQEIESLYRKLDQQESMRDRMKLRNLLYLTHDRGNARFQAYKVITLLNQLDKGQLQNFKSEYPMVDQMIESENSQGNDEFALLEFPLAEKHGIRYLYPTDDQSLRDLYHTSWKKAHEELKGSTILADFEGFVDQTKSKMGDFVMNGTALLELNNRAYQNLLYKLEYSFMPVGINVQKDLMNYYYMDRNVKMAQHIMDVAIQNPNKRIVAFYGVSHVTFINKILRAETNHRILTLPDLQAAN